MQPIRVLHMIGCLEIGGSQSMVMNLYRNIDRDKVQFDFIIDKEVDSPYIDEIKNLGGRIYKLPKFNGINLLHLRNSWINFFGKHPEYKILHSHVRSYASLYLPIAKKHGLITIIHSHSTSNGSGMASIAKKLLQIPLRWQADYFFACSEESGKWLFGNRVVKQGNFKIIPNAIDIKRYEFNEKSRRKIRNEFGIQDQFVVGHIGRFIEAKNHMFLVDIFGEFHKERPDSVLLLVGDGELRKAVERKVHDMHLQDSVIFAGVRNDVPDIMCAMDVFVFPSFYEGLPVTLVEAQVSGLNIIVSNTITDEVNLTKLYDTFDLNCQSKLWAEKILNKCGYKRESIREENLFSNFDITNVAVNICLLYENIDKQNYRKE